MSCLSHYKMQISFLFWRQRIRSTSLSPTNSNPAMGKTWYKAFLELSQEAGGGVLVVLEHWVDSRQLGIPGSQKTFLKPNRRVDSHQKRTIQRLAFSSPKRKKWKKEKKKKIIKSLRQSVLYWENTGGHVPFRGDILTRNCISRNLS